MDYHCWIKGSFLSGLVLLAVLLRVTTVTADLGLFGVRLCEGRGSKVLACRPGTVIQFVDVIFSLTKSGETCMGKEECRKSTSKDSIMVDRYDVCIRQSACDVDLRKEWTTCMGGNLFMANYTEVIYTCVAQDEFSLTLPVNRTDDRKVTFDMSAEDAANLPSTTTSKTLPFTNYDTTATAKTTTQGPVWKPVTDPPSGGLGEKSTIILGAVLAIMVLAFICVLVGFTIALKRGRIDRKKLPRCLVGPPRELPPDHVYASIDYATMHPRGRGGGLEASPINAATLQPQQLLRLPYMEFVDATGKLTPMPRTDPYYFVYDPAHRIVYPGGSRALHPSDPLFRSSSIVLERHPHPMTSPGHAHTHGHPHSIPIVRLNGQQDLPDLVHHEHSGSGSINVSFSEHRSDPSGVLECAEPSCMDLRNSEFLCSSLPDVSAIVGRQSISSGSSFGGVELTGNPQTVVSRQTTVDSAFEDDFDHTDESHSSSNHLGVERPEPRFMMDSHEYLAPVTTANQDCSPHLIVTQSPSELSSHFFRDRARDLHKAPTKRIRGNCAAKQPPSSVSTPCSPQTHEKGPLSTRKHSSRINCRQSRKSKEGNRKVESKSSPLHTRGSPSLALNAHLLENITPEGSPPLKARSEVNISDLPSHGLKFSPSVRV